jgi:uncharacterized protein with HEPN domain
MKSDSLFLSHVLGAIEKIAHYTAGIALEEFLSRSVIHDAVIRQLEIIGEAVKNIAGEAKAGQPEIRWKEIAGMRDRLIHGYFGVDLEAVWLTVWNDLPTLKRAVYAMLSDEKGAE